MNKSRKDRPVFASNLYKCRTALGWSQQKASSLLGIPRPTYGSYEEGRAQPNITFLSTLASVFSITNLIAFLENPAFSYHEQGREYTVQYESPLDKIYAAADEKNQRIVDMVLGIGTEKVTC